MGVFDFQFIGQIIGFIALFFVFLAFKETDDRKLIIYLAIGSAIWGLHFSLIGLIAAAGINFFDVLKNIIGLKFQKNKYWISFFVISYTIIGLITYFITQTFISFLPSVASIIGALGIFIFRGIALRCVLLSTLIIWFIYNYIGGSIPGMSSDIILIGATLYGIYKIRVKKTHILSSLYKRKKQDFIKKVLR